MAYDGQHRSDAFDGGLRAADHDRQRAGLRSRAAARHRRVEHLDAVRRQRTGHPPRAIRRNRAVIDDQGPRTRAARNPCSPSTTSSTAFVSVTIVMMMSAFEATSAGESPALAPAATNGAIASRRRAQTVTAWPAFKRSPDHR